ncbi:MAG: hypothetical protein RL685_6231 [Pseudomonadota bacterium]|jgi:short subunit dehydrogenase-like uncharacterized protein
MANAALVYGATGFTGRLIIDAALKVGLRPILAGRQRQRLEPLARALGLEFRAAELAASSQLQDALSGIAVVLNAAGPFVDTARPLVDACLQAGAHYLDVSGEVDALEMVASRSHEARSRGLMLLPGAGFDVVPSDCLCAHVASRVARPRVLRVAISGLELASPGSSATLTAELGRPTRVRRAGRLTELPRNTFTRPFDFGGGKRACAAVSWGDLASAHLTTGIENVETYFELTPPVAAMLQASAFGAWFFALPGMRDNLRRQAKRWTSEPSAAQRAARQATIVVEVEDANGRTHAARLRTPEAYTLTAVVAAEILRRVAGGDWEPGFQTPGRLFGPQLILGMDGVHLTELE